MPALRDESAQALRHCGGHCAARLSRNRYSTRAHALLHLEHVTDYPVDVDVVVPARFQRGQLALRIVMAIVLGWLGVTVGWIVCMLFAVLPLVAAIAISVRSSERFLDEVAPKVWRMLDWLLQLSAYMLLLVDTFPTRSTATAVCIDIRFTGKPTLVTALGRLVTSIPSLVVLCVLWLISGFLWLLAAVCVIGSYPQPAWLLSFQRGVMRWDARLLAYHASLVAEYPPFSLGSSQGHTGTLPHARAR